MAGTKMVIVTMIDGEVKLEQLHVFVAGVVAVVAAAAVVSLHVHDLYPHAGRGSISIHRRRRRRRRFGAAAAAAVVVDDEEDEDDHRRSSHHKWIQNENENENENEMFLRRISSQHGQSRSGSPWKKTVLLTVNCGTAAAAADAAVRNSSEHHLRRRRRRRSLGGRRRRTRMTVHEIWTLTLTLTCSIVENDDYYRRCDCRWCHDRHGHVRSSCSY